MAPISDSTQRLAQLKAHLVSAAEFSATSPATMALKDNPSQPYVLGLAEHGCIQGLTYLADTDGQRPICHYFGGLPYALPPTGSYRWRQARPLPLGYQYGTPQHPGQFTGRANFCPQDGPEGRVPPKEAWNEDCLQLNIFVPVGKPPRDEGWPVVFSIHGGYLQYGSPNGDRPIPLIAETSCKCIIVTPAYRLNLFGFLNSREIAHEAALNGEPAGNFGFWDQRLALEWTYRHISLFGGDQSNITVGGLSAGAHSTFHQLSYDLFLPSHRRIIRRAFMISNGSGVQLKPISDAQPQFDTLLSLLDIPISLSAGEKLARLRQVPLDVLEETVNRTKYHQYRGVTDGIFVRHDLFANIESGLYAQKMREANVQLTIGDVKDEFSEYSRWRPPHEDTFAAFKERLLIEYPSLAVEALLRDVYCPDGKLPTVIWPGVKSWTPDAFGRIYADLQVYSLERGFINKLIKHGAGDRVFRYRVEWRAKCLEERYPPDWGVTHGTDKDCVFFFGNEIGDGLTSEERKVVEGFVRPWWRFITQDKANSEDMKRLWGADPAKNEVRRLRGDGVTDVWTDTAECEHAERVWQTIAQALWPGGKTIERSNL